MPNISQPQCPKCESHEYKIIDGPEIRKTKHGIDAKIYLLQCLNHDCNRRYEWAIPLGWELENSPQ